MAYPSVSVSCTQDRHKQALRNLMYYETEQIRQELTRKALGAPYGRAPPPKLPKLSSILRHNESSVSSFRLSSQRKDSAAHHRVCHSEMPSYPMLTEPAMTDAQFLSPRADRYSTMSYTQETGYGIHSRQSSILPFVAQSTSLTPEPVFESDGFSNPFERPNGKCYFFPLEMFMDWSQLPTFPCQGFYLQPAAEEHQWSPCEVLSHDLQTRKFAVQWPPSTSPRLVPRKLLRFAHESEKQFSDIISLAHSLRRSHEGFVRYFARFEIAVSQGALKRTRQYEEYQGEIFRKIGIWMGEEARALVNDELWDLYRRCVTKFSFDTQYFAPKAELVLCPWKFDLHRQERWRTLITSTNLKSYPYKSSKRRVEEQFVNKGKALQVTRLIVYQRLTRLRWGDYYSCLRDFRRFQTRMNFFELKNEFRDRFSKETLAVDTMVKQLSDQIYKVLESAPSLLPEVEVFLSEAETVLESNLQFAVRRSVQLLVGVFQEYYSVLPVPGDLSHRFKNIPEYVVQRHCGYHAATTGKMISELQSIAIVKEMIGILYGDLLANRLYVYSLISSPLPLLTISIESKLTRERMQDGKNPDYFSLSDIKWEAGVRRSKSSRLKPSSRTELSDTIKVNKVIRNILQLTDECMSSDEDLPTVRYLLDEAVFGWVSAGKDKMIVDLNPTVPEIDTALQKMLKAPLKNILRIKRFALKPTEAQRVKVKNASAEIKSALRVIADVFQYSIYGPVALVALLREFDYLFSRKFSDIFFYLVKAHIEDYPGLISEIRTVLKHKELIEKSLPDCMQFGFFLVRLNTLKTEAKKNSEVLVEALLRELKNEHFAILTDITQDFDNLLTKLSSVPQTVEELDEMISFLDSKQDEKVMNAIKKELQKVAIIEDSLDEFHSAIGNEQSLMAWKTKSWELQLNKEKHRLTRRLQRLMPAFQDQVKQQVETLKSAIFTMKSDMAEFVTYSDVQNADQYASRATDVLERLQKLKGEVEVANYREKVLKLPKTDFQELLNMEEQFLSFHVFWNYASEWSSAYLSWMEKPLHFIDPDIVQSRFNKGLKLVERMKEEMANNLNVMRAVQEQEELLRSFERSIPLISSLRQDSLRDRHWKKIWDMMGRTSNDKSETDRKVTQTLRELLQRGIQKWTKEVEAVAAEARNEFEIEKIWTRIDKDLKIPNVRVVPHQKHSELQVIEKLDDFKDRLNEYLTTVNYLTKANRHIEPFREQLRALEQMIGSQQSIVEDLHEFQELLCELYPIFKIGELCEQLPRTAVRMNELMDYYTQQLAFIESEAKFTYPEASAELKKIREDVRLKIAEKQELCSRLYFLSDLQVLELLTAVNSGQEINVARLFPGVDELEVDEKTIVGIVRFGNNCSLDRPVSIRINTHVRNVEEWVADLDRALREQHSQNIQRCSRDFQASGVRWSADPDNEVMYTSYLLWLTLKIQTALDDPSARKLITALVEDLKQLLDAGIKEMRPRGFRSQSSLNLDVFALTLHVTPESQCPNEALAHLIIMHIDYLQKMLDGCDEDFQLQWKTALKLRETSSDPFALAVDCFDCTSPFGFETHSCDFLRSVIITPSTERLSLHVYLSLKHSMGAFLTGSRGFDKTETVKFLAVVCGRAYQSISVTTLTPFDRLMKFFVGCASGGFWGCVEEFHSLPAVYVSTLAKYTQMVLSALSPVVSRVTIDGYVLKPRAGFALFCTGERVCGALPLCVTETFRSIAVTKPDLSITAIVLLQASGITQSHKFGRLIASAMEQLDQPVLSLSSGTCVKLHIRANNKTLARVVRAIVTMERDNYIQDRYYIINNAFRQIYGVGLSASELAVLDEYLSTLFHALHNDKLSHIAQKGGPADVLAKMAATEEVAKPEVLQRRAHQLLSLMTAQEWVFVVGPANCGKSITISLVARALALSGAFRVHKLGAELTQSSLLDLYEHLENVSSGWFSLAFPGFYHSTAVGDSPAKYSSGDWIHVDAYRVPFTADALFSVVKSHPKSAIKLIFEAETLETIDPALIAEAGLVHLDKTEVDIFDFYMTAVVKVCGGDMAGAISTLEQLYQTLLLPALRFMEKVEQTAKVDSKFLVVMLMHLLTPFLAMLRKKAKLEESMKAIPLNLSKGSLMMLRRMNTVVPKQVPEEKRRETTIPNAALKDLLKNVGSIRKAVKIKPQMTLEAVFLMSLVNAFSNFIVNTDAFSNLVLEIAKEQPEEFAGGVVSEYMALNAKSLLEVVFSVKQMSWTLLSSAFSTLPQAMVRPSGRKGPVSQKPDYSLSYLENITCRLDNAIIRRDEVVIPSFSTQRLSYWVEFCFRNKVNIIVFGPHQSGKSSVTMSVAKELLGLSFSGLIPMNISSHMEGSVVQDLIETSMEERRKREFGGVGGGHFYAILDDMNLDPSNQIYDIFRFWRESEGWYSDGFTGIHDLTVAFVHSYVEGKSRPMWARATRHFLMLHKPGYTRNELTSIFRRHIDSTSALGDADADGMLSVAEESIRALVLLFNDLSLQHLKTERVWCQMSISNFSQALRFLAQFDLEDDVDIPQYLKLWTFTFARYFLDQFGYINSPIKTLLTDNLQTLIQRFSDSDQEAQEITRESVLIPSEEQLRDEDNRPFTAFDIINEESVETLVTVFRESRMHAAKLFPHRLKHLNCLLFNVEQRLSAYLSFYLNSIYDINCGTPSVIVRTAHQAGLVKALIYMAAETLKVRVFEFNAEEKEDVFASSLMENFKLFAPSYFPTEPRFEVKKIMEETMMGNKRVVMLVTLGEKQLERPLNRRFMEIALDILTGVRIRLAGFSNYYKDFIDKYRRSSPSLATLYNDEALQQMLDRMKANVTIMFVLGAEEDSWTRSPLHPMGVLEQFKHEYRSVFNKSRVVDFDHTHAPEAILNLVKNNDVLIDEWKVDFNTELLREVGEKLETLSLGITCSEYTYECVVYCCKAMMKELGDRRNEKRALLTKGIAQIQSIQSEIRNSDKKLEELSQKLETTKLKLEARSKQLEDSKKWLTEELAHPFEADLTTDIERRRTELASALEQARLTWESAIDQNSPGIEDLSEGDKLAGNPNTTKLVYLLYALVNQVKTDPSGDKVEAKVRKFVQQVGKKWKDMSKKLKHNAGDALLDLAPALEACEITPTARTSHSIRSVFDILSAAIAYRAAHRDFVEHTQTLDSEAQAVPVRAAELRRNMEERFAQQQRALMNRVEHLEAKSRELRKQTEYIVEKKPDFLDLAQSLQGTKETWTGALATFDEDEESALGECVLAGFVLVKGLRLSASQRQVLWKAVAKVLDAHEYDCQDSETLTPRLLPDFSKFAFDCVSMELTDSQFCMETAAFLKMTVDLQLPFPLIYDPFDVAFNYLARLEEPRNVLICRVSSDSEFERKFKDCVVEGRPVLCHNPSLSLYKAVFPAVVWRAQKFLMGLRGLNVTTCAMKLMQKNVNVHPDFRLYICYSDTPPAVVSQQMTEVNFDAEDRESWEGVLVVPLLKTLDEDQYRYYVARDVRNAQLRIDVRETESSFLQDLLTCDPKQTLVSETLQEKLNVGCHKVQFTRNGVRRVSALELIGGLRERHSTTISIAEDVRGPREKLTKVLAEFFDMRTVLGTLAQSLGDFAVPEKMLFQLILKALHEHIASISLPVESQWEALADSLVYNVFVRLIHSLPREEKAVFMTVFALFKAYGREQMQRPEFFQVLEDIIRVDSVKEDGVKYLRTRYPALFPSHFSPGSATFKLFLERDLFSDAKLPESYNTLQKFLLYAYLRPDLLPGFSDKVMKEALGSRYDWIPELHLDLHCHDTAKVPMVVFYEQTSPLEYIRLIAEARKISLVVTQPLMTSVVKTGKTEMRGFGRLSEMVMSTIASHIGTPRWIVVEGISIFSGLEAEVVTKFLLTKMSENTNDSFRIFVLLAGRPRDFPAWLKLVQQSHRVVLPEPSTIKDLMLHWHSVEDVAFFSRYQEALHRLFWANCALGPIAEKQVARNTAPRRKPTEPSAFPIDRASVIQSKTTFSVALLCSLIYLRNHFHSDLSALWRAAEAQMLLQDFLECLKPDVGLTRVLKSGPLAIFTLLLAPQVGHFATAAFLSLTQQVLGEDKPSLFVRSREGVTKVSTIEYPLFSVELPEKVANLLMLLGRYPSEDHLYLTGLSHSLSAAKNRALIAPLMSAAATLPLTILDTSNVLKADAGLALAAEKERVAEFLQAALEELNKELPESVRGELVLGKTAANYPVKKLNNWFDKEKSPSKAKELNMRNSIMDEPRSLQDTLAAIRAAEEQRRLQFLSRVRTPVKEMLRFLNYTRSTLGPEDMAHFVQLAHDQVPQSWLDLSPFAARHTRTVLAWKSQVVRCFASQAEGATLDLAAQFAPHMALESILRAFTLEENRKAEEQNHGDTDFAENEFTLQAKNVEVQRIAGFEHAGFSVSFTAEQPDPALFQVSVRGLALTNARVNPDNGYLEDCDKSLPVALTLAPVYLGKDLRNNPAYPRGLKLIAGQAALPWDAAAAVNTQRYGAPAYLNGRKPWANHPLLVYCPVHISEAEDAWLLLPSREPQGYWSKRGISASLS